MLELRPPRPVTGALGPNQLAWCRIHIRGFEVMEKQAILARAEIDAYRALAPTQITAA